MDVYGSIMNESLKNMQEDFEKSKHESPFKI